MFKTNIQVKHTYEPLHLAALAPILEIPRICVTYLYKNRTPMAISIWMTLITLSTLKFSILVFGCQYFSRCWKNKNFEGTKKYYKN